MKQNGFTLIEIIIYIALFGVLMTSALVTVYELLNSVEINKTALITQTEGTFINDKLRWAITGSTIVTTDGDILSIVPSTHIPFGQITFYVNDEILYIKRGTNPPELLTSTDMIVSDFSIIITPATGLLSEYIQVKYKLNQTPFIFQTYR